MCKIDRAEIRKAALNVLAGVVSSHFAKRMISHSLFTEGLSVVIELDEGYLFKCDIERVIKLVTSFDADIQIRVRSERLQIVLSLL